MNEQAVTAKFGMVEWRNGGNTELVAKFIAPSRRPEDTPMLSIRFSSSYRVLYVSFGYSLRTTEQRWRIKQPPTNSHQLYRVSTQIGTSI